MTSPEPVRENPVQSEVADPTTLVAAIGSVLTADEIRELLRSGLIFKKDVNGNDTYDEGNLRAAAYDLRMANDQIIVPNPEDPGKPLRCRTGEHRTSTIILKPGDVALLSTRERLAMPWNIAGNLGLKFSLASQGILTLTGLFVDPGYGLDSDDARLHFLVANVGAKDVPLVPGKERIAAIQFIRVSGSTEERIPPPDRSDVEREFFDPMSTTPPAGLDLFRTLENARQMIEETTDDRGDQ
jgi:deoxycytidine triphosphate deaminase